MNIVTNLGSLAQAVASSYANDALYTSFVFPRTVNMQKAFKHAIFVLEQEALNFDVVEAEVERSTELTAVSGRRDLQALLAATKPLVDELNLRWMDGLIVYRGGIDLFALRLTKNDTGCCAYVEINDYRRKLLAAASATKALADRKFATGALVVTTVMFFFVFSALTAAYMRGQIRKSA